jgi:hypothetical protein
MSIDEVNYSYRLIVIFDGEWPKSIVKSISDLPVYRERFPNIKSLLRDQNVIDTCTAINVLDKSAGMDNLSVFASIEYERDYA